MSVQSSGSASFSLVATLACQRQSDFMRKYRVLELISLVSVITLTCQMQILMNYAMLEISEAKRLSKARIQVYQRMCHSLNDVYGISAESYGLIVCKDASER